MTTSTERPTRRRFTLSDAGLEFWKHSSPWMIGATLVAALTARIIVGDWQITDALVPLVMIALFPFFEWIIHVFILHWRPKHLGRLTIDPLLAREHRAHHVDPRSVPLIFIPTKSLLWVIPLTVAIAVVRVPTSSDGPHLSGVHLNAGALLRVDPLPHPQRLQAQNPCVPSYLA